MLLPQSARLPARRLCPLLLRSLFHLQLYTALSLCFFAHLSRYTVFLRPENIVLTFFIRFVPAQKNCPDFFSSSFHFFSFGTALVMASDARPPLLLSLAAPTISLARDDSLPSHVRKHVICACSSLFASPGLAPAMPYAHRPLCPFPHLRTTARRTSIASGWYQRVSHAVQRAPKCTRPGIPSAYPATCSALLFCSHVLICPSYYLPAS